MPSKEIDITVDKNEGELKINADGKEVSIRAGQDAGNPEVSVRDETPAPDDTGRKTPQRDASAGK